MKHLRAPGWAAFLALPLLLRAAPMRSVAEFQAQAAPYHSEIRVPPFEATPVQVREATAAAMAAGDAAIDRLVRQDPAASTFDSTFVALDAIRSDVELLKGDARRGGRGREEAAGLGDRHRLPGGHLRGAQGVRGPSAGAFGRGQ